jgi:peptidoglycan/xylan/chitin deacetylase (PgdA/CDA1 family)
LSGRLTDPLFLHLITLSFDDGFSKSFTRVAEIHEKFGLKACLNVIASGHQPDFVAPDKWHEGFPKGDFGLWNELQARGHEIMPHGYKHADKSRMPFEEAKSLVLRCLEIFERELKGFQRSRAIFNFPYSHGSPELEDWLRGEVRAIRRGGGDAVNPLPQKGMYCIYATGSGEDDCEEDLDRNIEALLSRPEGWLVYCPHGLDGEGWGPLRSLYLERLLERLLKIPSVRILPTGAALDLA